MYRESVPDNRSCDTEAPFAEFCNCRQHGQVTTSSTADTPEQQLNLCPDACASDTKQDNLLLVKGQ